MSRQKGIIKLSGSMDGLTFYSAYGKDLVRKSAGPSKEQIMTGDNFARTRENHQRVFGLFKNLQIVSRFPGPVTSAGRRADAQPGDEGIQDRDRTRRGYAG